MPGASPSPKAALRSRLLAARRALEPGERERCSVAIAARVAALPSFAAAGSVALYAPLGSEVDTGPLAQAALGEGKRLLWPRVGPGGRALEFAPCDPEALVPGPLRALQPPPSAAAVPLVPGDLLCVPGLGFDGKRRRLGRGGGHYDATLDRLSGLGASITRVGLCFECQLVDALPAEPHDAPVDLVATEERLLGNTAG